MKLSSRLEGEPVEDSGGGRREAAGECRAIAHSNIALAKYWGKRDVARNLPDVPSLSLTLAGLSTTTSVCFDRSLTEDSFELNGKAADSVAARRVRELLDRVRGAARLSCFARVKSSNDFPTASGLASSASGFAALARASLGAAGLHWSDSAVSDLARASSVSAARSVFGGFVTLEAGADSAEPLGITGAAGQLKMIIAATEMGPKAVGSTNGMLLTQATSPYYEAWRRSAPAVYSEIRGALLAGDLARLGEAMEHSGLMMHASMLAARPALIYWNAATLAAIGCVRELRQRGTFAYFTIDAGPHVKVLSTDGEAEQVRSALRGVPGVRDVLVSGIGPGARILEAP
jgi:diphosphomevalonate decarboxylase